MSLYLKLFKSVLTLGVLYYSVTSLYAEGSGTTMNLVKSEYSPQQIRAYIDAVGWSKAAEYGVYRASDTPVLTLGKEIWSAKRTYKLKLTPDGNLCKYKVEYVNGVAKEVFKWCNMVCNNAQCSKQFVPNSSTAFMIQKDGNLVVYQNTSNNSNASGPVWASNTWQDLNIMLVFYQDGELYLYKGDSTLWQELSK